MRIKELQPFHGAGLTQVLPVLYINLERDKERRSHIERELTQVNLRPIRIRAVGPLLPHGIFAETLSAGEIGAYASHMKAWSTLLVSGHPHALVLEDDARVRGNLAELVDLIIAALPEDWDLVHLYDDEGRPARPLRPVGVDHKLVRHARVPRGCVGYLISRSGAQKLSRQEQRCWPVDTDFRRPWHFLLNSYGIRPPLVKHDSEFPSAILRAGPRSRRRRGIAISNPLHSVQGAMWNFERLGISWWLYSFAVNSWRRLVRVIGRLARRHEQLLVSGEVRLKEVLAVNKKPRRSGSERG
jgi:glycosyl transferase family 25